MWKWKKNPALHESKKLFWKCYWLLGLDLWFWPVWGNRHGTYLPAVNDQKAGGNVPSTALTRWMIDSERDKQGPMTALAHWREGKWNRGGLTEWRRESLELREAKLARLGGQSAGAERAAERPHQVVADVCVYAREGQMAGERAAQRSSRTVLGAHTGLRIVCVYTSQDGKTVEYTGHS